MQLSAITSIKRLRSQSTGVTSEVGFIPNTTIHEFKITSYDRYHWAFNVSTTDTHKGFAELTIVQNNKLVSIYKCAFWKDQTIDIYLEIKTKLVAIHSPDIAAAITFQIHKLRTIRNIKDCKFKITTKHSHIKVIKQFKIKKNSLCLNKLHNDITKWKKTYLFALRLSPYIEEFNNEYLWCLLSLKQYNKAYKHAIEFKKGAASICMLILDYYYTYRDKKRAHKLLQQFTDSQLCEHDLYFEMARCSETFGDKRTALKYYQLFFHEQNTSHTINKNSNVLRCISNMASIYYDNYQFQHALQLYLKLDRDKIDSENLNAQVGICYWKTGHWNHADFYFQRSIEIEEDNIWLSRLQRLFIKAQKLNHEYKFRASINKCLKLVYHPLFDEFRGKYIFDYSICELMINNFAMLSNPDGVRKITNILKKNKRCMNCNASTWNQRREKKATTRLRKCKGCNVVFLCSRKCHKYHWKLFHRNNCVKNYYE
eukprot:418741_1